MDIRELRNNDLKRGLVRAKKTQRSNYELALSPRRTVAPIASQSTFPMLLGELKATRRVGAGPATSLLPQNVTGWALHEGPAREDPPRATGAVQTIVKVEYSCAFTAAATFQLGLTVLLNARLTREGGRSRLGDTPVPDARRTSEARTRGSRLSNSISEQLAINLAQCRRRRGPLP